MLVNTGFMNENKLNISLIRGLICGLRCRNHPDKAECSMQPMFVDSHTQNSKNDRIFFRDARFCSLCEEIFCSRVRSNEEGV